jgi:hypothetical protein
MIRLYAIRWAHYLESSLQFWNAKGYLSIDVPSLQASHPDWYSKRPETTTFAKDLMIQQSLLAPTVDGEQKGTPPSLGKPSTR